MEPFFAELYKEFQYVHSQLDQALDGLSQEALDWSPGEEINSLAVLATHVAGSERYWVGDVAGGDPSGRVRATEFEMHGRDAAALQARLAEVLDHTHGVLARLTVADLEREVYASIQERSVTAAWALLHALDHAAEHMGHCQLMRQLWDQNHEHLS